jgi:LysR family cys regulon transcriptional activator
VYVLMEMLAPELTRDRVSEAVAQPAPLMREVA